MRDIAVASAVLERVCEPQLDERLTRDADAPRFLIDGAQQIRGKVDVHALHFTAGTTSFRPVDVLVDLVGTRVEQLIEFVSRERLRRFPAARIALFLFRVPDGPR